MEKYYFEFLRSYFYDGDYYKIDKVNEMIDNSNFTSLTKGKLKKFINDFR